MYEWASFDAVFRLKPDYSLDSKQVDSIARERKEFGGVLFFDRIWTSIGLKQPQKSYPARSNADLRALWSKIATATAADEKKQAVLLYVLRDCVAGGGSKVLPQLDTKFAQKTYLPLKYQILISGLWELDHAQFPRALEHLTDPMLTAEFADDVLLALLQSPKCDSALPMAYYITVRPPLVKEEALKAYFELLVRTNVVEAYYFAQKQDDAKHHLLFETIVKYVHDEEDAVVRADRAVIFLSLPFSNAEEQWFEDYLVHGAGSGLPNAKDSVIMRRMALGKTVDSIGKLGRHRGTSSNSVDWNDIRSLRQTAGIDGAMA